MSNEDGVTPLDILRKKKKLEAEMAAPAANAVAANRMDLCRHCYHFRKLTQQCKICHCFMPGKVTLSGATCALPHPDFPGEIRKWDSVVIRSATITSNEEMQDESSHRT